jgi:two-component system sensor histidine kinase DesK
MARRDAGRDREHDRERDRQRDRQRDRERRDARAARDPRQELWPPWRRAIEDADDTPMARAPENRKQALVKLAWISIWLLYLGSPVSDLTGGHHTGVVTACAALGLTVFVTGYLSLVFLRTNTGQRPERWVYEVLVAQTALSLLLSGTLGKDWLVLFVYVAVACGAALPSRQSRWAVPAVTLLLFLVGMWTDPGSDLYPALLIPSLLGGYAMVGVKQLVQAMRELREARATVAHLAATEERLRLARDLHDLLGHSLSLITLKSELAGRMLPDRPDDAAQQVADIEKVSRQALVDVREAVSGYRRPTLPAELASARSALASAGIAARLHVDDRPPPGLGPEGEGALAWALREAVTNVVRHSGAATCVVALAVADGVARLTVSDDGRGPGTAAGAGAAGTAQDTAAGVSGAASGSAAGAASGAGAATRGGGASGSAAGRGSESGSGGAAEVRLGNGLTGLAERLILAGGTLDVGRAGDGGFRLTASVPADQEPAPVAAPGPPGRPGAPGGR